MEAIKELYLEAKKQLEKAGIPDPAFDAACIFEKHTGKKRHEIVLYASMPVSFDTKPFWDDIKRRILHEPLQYIIGMWQFYGLEFYVGKGVLIPRPDTEILCEIAIEFLKKQKSAKLLELCAGSGCLSTAIAKNVENCEPCCVELSNDAIFYLKKNLKFHELSQKAEVIKADVLLKDTVSLLPEGFDAIVCNPPYIKSGDIKGLEPEVADFEPHLALDGGEDGLKFYRVAKNYLPLLKPGGMMAFEIGFDEAPDVAELFSDFGICGIFVKKDFGGNDRVVGGYKG